MSSTLTVSPVIPAPPTPTTPTSSSSPLTSSLSSTSSSSSSDKTKWVEHRVEELAHEIMAEINRITSSEDIIPFHKIPELAPKHMRSLYPEHGENLLTFINHHIERYKVNIAVTTAVNELLSKFASSKTAILVAKARFGLGDCSEKTALAVLKCTQVGIRSLAISGKNRKNPEKNHYLLMLNASESDIPALVPDCSFLEYLMKCKEGILFDPLLKQIFPISSFDSRGAVLRAYIEQMGIDTVIDVNMVGYRGDSRTEYSSRSQEVNTKASAIYERAKAILATNTIDLCDSRHFKTYKSMEMAKEIVQRLIVDDIMKELKAISSHEWKKNVKNGITFWTEGSKSEMDALYATLTKIGMTASVSRKKNGEEYVCMMHNPSLGPLRRFSAAKSSDTVKP